MPWNVIVVEASRGFDWFGAVSTLLGVLLGAALTYFVTRRIEASRTKEQQLGHAYSLLFTVQKMSDDLVKLERLIAEIKAEAKREGVEGPLWTILDDVVGYSKAEMSVSPEGLALVALTKDTDLLMGVMEVESAHRIWLTSLHRLAELRAKMDSSGLQTKVEGKIVSYGATPEQYAKIAPTIIRLETLSKGIETGLPKSVETARFVSERLGPLLKKHFQFKHFMSIAFQTPNADEPCTPPAEAVDQA
jgi:hypothetical protein